MVWWLLVNVCGRAYQEQRAMNDHPHSAGAGTIRRLDITDREFPCFAGERFAAAGQYVRLAGRLQATLDPLHPLNAGIVNLRHAPRNVEGQVEYATDFCILHPAGPGNGILLYDVVNRGTLRSLAYFNTAPPSQRPSAAIDAGNGYLMREGYCLAWSGWQGDVVSGAGRLTARLPIATDGARPMTGLSREEFICDAPGSSPEDRTQEVSPNRFVATLSYPAADLEAAATLTVRENERDDRVTPPSLTWRYVDAEHIEITRPDDAAFDRGAIYEFIYTARDPVVFGIGFAAIRDFIGLLRSESDANPLAGRIRNVIGFGLSQSGRVLRDFVYQGFNLSSSGGSVFDAIMPVVAGSRRTFVNASFAQPGRYPRQHEDHSFPDDQFPFTYATLHDPVSGSTDGILARATQQGVRPKVMHVDTDSELWNARASLVVTDTEGKDIAQPDGVRVFLAATHQHGAYTAPPPKVTRHDANPLCYQAILRPLLAGLRAWIQDGIEPPPSCFPSHSSGTLVDLEAARAAFPAIPGMEFPDRLNSLALLDHSCLPPMEGAEYPVFVSRPDADGNALGGIRHPLTQVPIGTHTGWNLRASGFAAGELYSIMGSYLPFALEREKRGADPRLSLIERYGSHAGWLEELQAVTTEMVLARLLLAEDRTRILAAAAKSWNAFSAT
jgi:hypothetical protein